MLKLILILWLTALVSPVVAASFDTQSQVMPIIMKHAHVYKMIQNNFELSNNGIGSMVGTNVNPKLGHARIGPYRIMAKIKGAEKWGFILVIHTNVAWHSSDGKEATFQTADSFTENLKSVEIMSLP